MMVRTWRWLTMIAVLVWPDYKFPSSKSNCTILNKWHVISVTWSNGKNLSNCWSNGEKLITFNTGNTKGSDHCFIGDLGTGWGKSHLTGCIGEIIGFYRSLTFTLQPTKENYWENALYREETFIKSCKRKWPKQTMVSFLTKACKAYRRL